MFNSPHPPDDEAPQGWVNDDGDVHFPHWLAGLPDKAGHTDNAVLWDERQLLLDGATKRIAALHVVTDPEQAELLLLRLREGIGYLLDDLQAARR